MLGQEFLQLRLLIFAGISQICVKNVYSTFLKGFLCEAIWMFLRGFFSLGPNIFVWTFSFQSKYCFFKLMPLQKKFTSFRYNTVVAYFLQLVKRLFARLFKIPAFFVGRKVLTCSLRHQLCLAFYILWLSLKAHRAKLAHFCEMKSREYSD